MIFEFVFVFLMVPAMTSTPTPNPAKYTPKPTPCIASATRKCPTATRTPHIGPYKTKTPVKAFAIPEPYLTATAAARPPDMGSERFHLTTAPQPSASPTPKPGKGCGHAGGSTLALLAVGVGLIARKRYA